MVSAEASYGQLANVVIARTVSLPIMRIYYSFVPADLMEWSKTFIRGTVLMFGMFLGSLIALVLAPLISVNHISLAGLILSVAWLIEVWVMRKHFRRILKQVIVRDHLDFDHIASLQGFETGVAAFARQRKSPSDVVDGTGTSRGSLPTSPDTGDGKNMRHLLSHRHPEIRAGSARSLSGAPDLSAVPELLGCLDDPVAEVRRSSVQALMSYGPEVVPYLEVSLLKSPERVRRGILEAIRLGGIPSFDPSALIDQELRRAFDLVLAVRALDSFDRTPIMELFVKHLTELKESCVRMIFYCLWVNHSDMRLLYEALKSETAPVALELIETVVSGDIASRLICLIDKKPLDEMVKCGWEFYPVRPTPRVDRTLLALSESDLPLTSALALMAMAETGPQPCFLPAVESSLGNMHTLVRNAAGYALQGHRGQEAKMPELVEQIGLLQQFPIFHELELLELHAIASVLESERFDPGEVIVREGVDNSSIYLLLKGSVGVYERYGSGAQKEKAVLGPNQIFGELSFFTGSQPRSTCVAVGPVEVFVLRHRHFKEIMELYPQIPINMCRVFVRKLEETGY